MFEAWPIMRFGVARYIYYDWPRGAGLAGFQFHKPTCTPHEGASGRATALSIHRGEGEKVFRFRAFRACINASLAPIRATDHDALQGLDLLEPPLPTAVLYVYRIIFFNTLPCREQD